MCKHISGIQESQCSYCLGMPPSSGGGSTHLSGHYYYGKINPNEVHLDLNSPEHWEILGRIAKWGKLTVQGLSWKIDEFVKEYKISKGVDPGEEWINRNEGQWGVEMRLWVYFDIGDIVDRKRRSDKGADSNALVEALFDFGFNLGTTHNIEEIRSHCPNAECLNAFNKGYNKKKGLLF